jgi:hypothetical protein
VLDTTPVLAAAEPGAFLDKDIHMTPRGHAAVAAALAKVIAAPPPTIPAERTVAPIPVAWHEAHEVIVTGSSSAGCETKMIHEWLRVMCGRVPKGAAPPSTEMSSEEIMVDDPTKVAIEKDDSGEAMVLAMPHQTSMLAPVLRGRDIVVQFTWTDHTRRLHVSWPSDQPKPTLAFDAVVKVAGKKSTFSPYMRLDRVQKFESPVERAICKCWNTTFQLEHYTPYDAKDEVFACSGVYGSADAACTTTYATDCPRMIECIRHDPASPAK